MVEERYRKFLVDDVQADRIGHDSVNLYSHLAGTYRLLQEWGNPIHVCLAGLFHSIYGTVHFRRRAVPLSARPRLRTLIGEEAERLAYIFCVTDRPAAFLSEWRKPEHVLYDRYLKDQIVLNRQELLWLLEIEAANLIEQGGKLWLADLRRIPLSQGAIDALKGREPSAATISAATESATAPA